MKALARFVTGIGLLLALGAAAAPADAAPAAPATTPPPVQIEQRLGAALPLGSAFIDENGRRVSLGDYFAPLRDDGVPVLLVLGYYRCPRLCETVLEGALEAVAASGAQRSGYRVVEVSVDQAETPADARARLRTDTAIADLAAERAGSDARAAGPLDLHALVGNAASIDILARAVGFGFAERERQGPGGDTRTEFDHAAGFVVVTPQGRVSRYFLGVRQSPLELRRALAEARGGTIGGLVDRLLLLCAHVDPALGRWSAVVLLLMRAIGIALAAGLALWIWRHRRARTGGANA